VRGTCVSLPLNSNRASSLLCGSHTHSNVASGHCSWAYSRINGGDRVAAALYMSPASALSNSRSIPDPPNQQCAFPNYFCCCCCCHCGPCSALPLVLLVQHDCCCCSWLWWCWCRPAICCCQVLLPGGAHLAAASTIMCPLATVVPLQLSVLRMGGSCCCCWCGLRVH
jgi:hypothetical protein